MTDLPTKQEVETHARATIGVMTEWVCKEFGFAAFEPMDLYITFQSNYFRSRAGRGLRDGLQHAVVHLHLHQFTVAQSLGHYEYAEYGDDLEIGGFQSTDWRLHLDALIAHEISHAVQQLLPHWKSRFDEQGKSSRYGELGQWGSGHGEFYQNIYRLFRREFINPRLEFYQLGQPRESFVLNPLASQATGERIVGSDNRVYEVLGRKPRARTQVYWIRDLCSHEILTLSPQELYQWWPSLHEAIGIDGYLVSTKMAA